MRTNNRNNQRNAYIKTLGWLLIALVSLFVGVTLWRGLFQWLKGDQENLNTNTPLSNPYGNAQLCGGNNPVTLPLDISECDALERVSTTYSNPDQTSESINCLRKMTEPAMECFKKAVNDGINAKVWNDDNRFHSIMASWPAQNRKEIHDKVIEGIKKFGIFIKSTMPPLSPNFLPANQIEKISMGPYRRDALVNQVPLDADSTGNMHTRFTK